MNTTLTVTTATPVEIDERIARIEGQVAQVRAGLEKIRKDRARYDQADSYYRMVTQEDIERQAQLKPKLEGQLVKLRELVAPLHAEFERRDGWTRWYLVAHLHYDVSGSRCNRRPTSDHYWVTDYSGKSEAEVIKLAGTLVCTTCFPDAPVTTRQPHPRLMRPEVAHALAIKEQKAREKAAKEASWMRMPDGELLFAVEYRQGEFKNDGQLKTERAANNRALQDLANLAIWFGPDDHDAPGWVETVRRCVLVLAHLRKLPPSIVYGQMVEKMGQKAGRENMRLQAGWDAKLRPLF
jgi:hypothetical protein